MSNKVETCTRCGGTGVITLPVFDGDSKGRMIPRMIDDGQMGFQVTESMPCNKCNNKSVMGKMEDKHV